MMRKGKLVATALLAIAGLLIPASANAVSAPSTVPAPKEKIEIVYWDLPDAYRNWDGAQPPPGDEYKRLGLPSIWPQTYDPKKKACGGWWQWDEYDVGNPKVAKALKHAKKHGLNYMQVEEQGWGFVKQPPCEVPVKEVTPIAPTVTPGTGKCWAGEWKIAKNGQINLPRVENAQWKKYGESAVLTGLAPGDYTFELIATKGHTILDQDGFVDGRITVTIPAPEPSDDCGPPPPKVKKGKWKHKAPDCENSVVYKVRKVTTWDWVWSKKKGDWVLGKPTVTRDHAQRDLTSNEARACTPVPEPFEDAIEKVTDLDCENQTAHIERTITSTTYTWNDDERKYDEDVATHIETYYRDMTPEEAATCPEEVNEPPVEEPPVEEPPTEEPPAEEPPVEEPPVVRVPDVKIITVDREVPVEVPAPVAAKRTPSTATVEQLPRTGSSTGQAALLASVLMTLGAGALASARVWRKQQR